jgi:putative endopeptidase
MKRYRLPVAALLSCSFAVSSAAALDVSDFDDSVDACTDFYNYVNHKWLESSNIPDDRNSWGSDTTVVIRN